MLMVILFFLNRGLFLLLLDSLSCPFGPVVLIFLLKEGRLVSNKFTSPEHAYKLYFPKNKDRNILKIDTHSSPSGFCVTVRNIILSLKICTRALSSRGFGRTVIAQSRVRSCRLRMATTGWG